MRFPRAGLVSLLPGASELRPWPTRRPPRGARSRSVNASVSADRSAKKAAVERRKVRALLAKGHAASKDAVLIGQGADRRSASLAFFAGSDSSQATARPRRKQQGRRSRARLSLPLVGREAASVSEQQGGAFCASPHPARAKSRSPPSPRGGGRKKEPAVPIPVDAGAPPTGD